MSNKVLSRVLKLSVKRSSDKFILVCMANYADDEGRCYPSHAALARDTSLDRKTIIAGIRRLVAAGLVLDTGCRTGGTGRVPVYVIGGDMVPETGPLDDGVIVPFFPPNSPVFPAEWSRFSRQWSQKRDLDTSDTSKDTSEDTSKIPSSAPPAVDPEPPAEASPSPQPPPVRRPSAAPPPSDDSAAFHASFWPLYPRKTGKDAALRAWTAARKRGAAEADIIAGLRAYAFSADPKYQPHAATWLNGGRWIIEADTRPVTIAPGATNGTARPSDSRLRAMAQILGQPFTEPFVPDDPFPSIDIPPGDYH
ncbi:Helix-turn-helix domain containing protein [uncultured Caudovirales phage]|uniref:Helix-turn-helix domain containing protein n=1 Tax=uncultured Caudovirales phage TaxID=2100421 RepID=A0A6J5ME70_9CAUD|nr:Helix-turn-helix domain containing protein [uncultured Caudovirales phage]CAB4189653.1 Helix-turn-helix domain containing protein [uncultured Caudovirales phage]